MNRLRLVLSALVIACSLVTFAPVAATAANPVGTSQQVQTVRDDPPSMSREDSLKAGAAGAAVLLGLLLVGWSMWPRGLTLQPVRVRVNDRR